MYDLEGMDARLVIFGSLFCVANRLQSKMDARMRDLTAKQWFVLLMLGMFEKPPTLKQLARMCDSSHQNIKQIVSKLQEKGFITITEDEADARAMRIATTAKCDEWDKENSATAARFVDDMFRGMAKEDIGLLRDMILKIFDNLGALTT